MKNFEKKGRFFINLKLNDGLGITLISLLITIIVLLILAGISVVIINSIIMDKAFLASTQTIDSLLEESIQMAYIECNSEFLLLNSKGENLDKSDYLIENFSSYLSDSKNIDNVKINQSGENDFEVSFNYKEQEYKYRLTLDGNVHKDFSIKGNLKVGDYIEYPVDYKDVYSNEFYDSNSGWRVIDDGQISGKIKIISTGIPAKWLWNDDINTAIQNLIYNFDELLIRDSSNEIIEGNFFKVGGIAENVSILTLSEFNNLCNRIYGSNRSEDDISDFPENYDLFYLNNSGAYYWLATNNIEENMLYCVAKNSQILLRDGIRLGLRPVIELNSNINVVFDNSVWKIVN